MSAMLEAEQKISDIELLEAMLELLKKRGDAGAICYMAKDGPTALTWGSGGRVYHVARHLANNAAERFIDDGGDPLFIDRSIAMSFLEDARQRYLKGGRGSDWDVGRSGEMLDSFTGRMEGYQTYRIPQDK